MLLSTCDTDSSRADPSSAKSMEMAAAAPCLSYATAVGNRTAGLRRSCFGLSPALSSSSAPYPWRSISFSSTYRRHHKGAFGLHRRRFASAALPFDLSPPPIDHDLLDTATVAGAQLSEDGIIETFDNDDEALDAADNGVAVADLSHFGRIRVSGDDRVQFLHNQSTANFERLQEGQGCDTVFVTATARTIDIAHAWIMKNAITLVVSPETYGSITNMLNKYIFFADKVEIQDITKKTCLLTLMGPKSNQVMENLNLGDLIGKPYGTHQHYNVNGMPITVGVGNAISEEGYSLLISPSAAATILETLVSEGAIPMGSRAWEKLRIIKGRPAPGKELTDEFNVLEAGLWNSISLDKGCYKGQETIARLVTYNGVKQRLWGISLSAKAEPGSSITVDGKKVGKLTSYTSGRREGEHFGLGYIKKQVSEGNTVIVGDGIVGTVVEVPFLAQQSTPKAQVLDRK